MISWVPCRRPSATIAARANGGRAQGREPIGSRYIYACDTARSSRCLRRPLWGDAPRLRGLSLVLLFAIFLACTGNDTPSVEEARDFKAFDIWWLGEEFEAFRLSHADQTSFLYGTCKPPPREGGCAPPAQVILQELCSFPPFDFEPSGAEEVFRGAATFLPVRDGQALVGTGTAAITLFGQDDAMTRRMAERLESLNLDPYVMPGEPMPPSIECTDQ